MSDDWKPGDEALCVKVGAWSMEEGGISMRGPEAGKVYTVVSVEYAAPFDEPCDEAYLVLAEFLGEAWWSARFIKAKPHTPDREDAEVIALLNGAGVKEASDA